jgi:hypothetical protein
MTKTSNANARQFVQDRKEFVGSNTFGRWVNGNYVVYSYGLHFPIFVWSGFDTKWYQNSDKYSATTSRHKTQLHPWFECQSLNTKELQTLINKTYA